jgi:hypothetical protein
MTFDLISFGISENKSQNGRAWACMKGNNDEHRRHHEA